MSDDTTPWRLPRGNEIETQRPHGIDTKVAHPARMYDYYLGGKNNFAADRAAADRILDAAPEARLVVREGRAFLRRAVRFAAEQGMTQFLDIGTGLPTEGSVHEVVQAVRPETRVAYVDNDPVVLAHARALMPGDPRGRVTYTQADAREPDKVLGAADVCEVIDFDKPVAVVLAMLLHFIQDEEDPAGIVARLREAMAPGSLLILSHVTYRSEELKQLAEDVYQRTSSPVVPRTREEITGLLDGFDLVDPGLVRIPLWRPDPDAPLLDGQELDDIVVFGAVGVRA
ncbi:SAM-dependent methyltransferase [Yinghuangia soli]|uniref:SAM-dependent methyltransferase n=1 Tax=Yinghuangia soli TaxID=2908204 RepID=A0AA41Q607_9ACTN|nr:SAM-dependent methyltransferase [Yinghuangia soli]MCF2530994.1 SAM-dependent methyltransferase [Yinghuangia soli]